MLIPNSVQHLRRVDTAYTEKDAVFRGLILLRQKKMQYFGGWILLRLNRKQYFMGVNTAVNSGGGYCLHRTVRRIFRVLILLILNKRQ